LKKAYHYAGMVEPNADWVEKYPPGQSFLLSLMVHLGDDSVYLLNPIVLTLLTLFYAKILRNYNIPKYFSLLLLYNPAIFLFSRTVLSDLCALLLFALGFFIFNNTKNLFLGSLFIFLSISFRLAYAPLAFVLVLYHLCNVHRNTSDIVWVATGTLLGMLPIVFYISSILKGGAFGYSHDFIDVSRNLSFFPPNLFQSVLSLNFIYPLMFIVGFIYLSRIDKSALLISILPFIYMPFMPQTAGLWNNQYVTFILIQRYYFVSIFLLMIGYSVFIRRHIVKNVLQFSLILFPLILVCSLISIFHSNYLNNKVNFNKQIYRLTSLNSMIISDEGLMKFLSAKDGSRRYVNAELFGGEALYTQIDNFEENDIYLILNSNSEIDPTINKLYKILKKYKFEAVCKYKSFIFFKKEYTG